MSHRSKQTRTHPPHDLSNLCLVKKHFDQLPADDISRRYYSGEKYEPSFANRLRFLFFTRSTLSELQQFYPYQPLVKRTYEHYIQKSQLYTKYALGFSAISIFTVYQLARRNFVIPVFSKFGTFLKTHRLLRQYVWLAVLPYTVASFLTNDHFANQTERLWSVHANRLNNKILTDPRDSEYPIDLLPVSQVHTWRPEWIHKYDIPKKLSNQVDIFEAPDYAELEQWQKVQIAEPEEKEAGQGQQAAGEESGQAQQ